MSRQKHLLGVLEPMEPDGRDLNVSLCLSHCQPNTVSPIVGIEARYFP
jgi:hypothetical protein